MTTKITNYLQAMPADIMELIYKYNIDSNTDDIESQIKLLESRLSNCFFKKVRASNKFPEHLIMDGFFHINPTIDIDLMVSGPVLVQCADLFAYNAHYQANVVVTTSLTISGDNTIKDILVKIIKHIGRRNNITRWHEGCEFNCIHDIQIDDEAEDSDDEDTPQSDVKNYINITFSNNINGCGWKNKKFPKKYGLLRIN